VLRFEDFVERTQRAKTVDDLAKQYAEAIASEGYENSILTSLRGRGVGHVVWLDFPEGYTDAYISRRWEMIDPVLAKTLRAPLPFFWNDVTDWLQLSQPQTEFIEDCRDLKVHSGIVFPIHGPGQRLDVISISRRVSDPGDRGAAPLLHAVTVQAWARFLEITNESDFVSDDKTLTARELEILCWLKDGKSRPEIGEILGLSHKTVEYHLANIMDKLGANNQISAVVIALQKGHIVL
jgi:LuxR family transcriptional regulator, quorum-sensing system regulator SolR